MLFYEVKNNYSIEQPQKWNIDLNMEFEFTSSIYVVRHNQLATMIMEYKI